MLAKLDEVLTDSMNDGYYLFGFCTKKGDNWELNTDRCSLHLANMMQIIRLQRDIWKVNRHCSVRLDDAMQMLRTGEGRWVEWK